MSNLYKAEYRSSAHDFVDLFMQLLANYSTKSVELNLVHDQSIKTYIHLIMQFFYLLHLWKVNTFCFIVTSIVLKMFFYNIDRVICYNGSYASLILGISYAKPKRKSIYSFMYSKRKCIFWIRIYWQGIGRNIWAFQNFILFDFIIFITNIYHTRPNYRGSINIKITPSLNYKVKTFQ